MVKIFSAQQIKEVDAGTIREEGITSTDLMERAAGAVAKAIMQRWHRTTGITVFAGPGNNGGDALAVARILHEAGYTLEVFSSTQPEN